MSAVESALFIRGGALGDFILTLPSVHAFREAMPQARIEIMGYPSNLQLVKGRYYAQSVANIDQGGMAGFFARNSILDPKLSEFFKSFSLIVSFLYAPEGTFESNLKRAAPQTRLITAEGRPATTTPASQHLATWLPKAGIFKAVLRPPKIYPSEEDLKSAGEELRRLGGEGPWILIHPGSGSQQKRWPVENFAKLSRILTGKGFCIGVLEGPADTGVGEAFQRSLEIERKPEGVGVVARLQNLPLNLVAAMLASSRGFIGNDSGITHLAAAVGAPTIAVFGPTSSRIWGPTGALVKVLQKGVATDLVTVGDVEREIKKL
jgi:heptosyltransferase III